MILNFVIYFPIHARNISQTRLMNSEWGSTSKTQLNQYINQGLNIGLVLVFAISHVLLIAPKI